MLCATLRGPPFSCAHAARPVVNGKYKSARKKVVSVFIKELIACMGFLNRGSEIRQRRGHSKFLVFLRHTWGALMKSLRSYQDFLRRDSLSCP
jgi:hypothetical protein